MLQPDANLGPYRLIARIGAGGMGEVWKAEDTRLGRTVAIKVLPQQVSSDREATARLEREARTAAQLYHPNIATIHSIEQEGELLFIVMEYVEGEPLTHIIRRGGMAESDIVRIGRGVADALAEAHAKGIVHRDIKPDNIMVRGPRVKVLDFGIAKQVDAVPSSPDAPTAFETQQGMILGTIHYMSPEQALGKKLDARTDIFSLGVVLYQAATGRLPFKGETATETMTQIIRDDPPQAARVNPGISSGLNAIIERCLRKNRDERFHSADELRDALDHLLTSAPTVLTGSQVQTVKETAARKRGARLADLAVIAVLLAIGGVALAYWLSHRTPAPAATHAPAPKPVAQLQPQPAPASTLTVVAPAPQPEPQPVIVQPQPAPEPEPERRPEPTPQPAPPPVAEEKAARQRLRHGERALFNHNFAVAREQLGAALADPTGLDEREQALARLGLAIASFRRGEAVQIARDIESRWPGDPDLERIQREFAERPMRPRRRPFH